MFGNSYDAVRAYAAGAAKSASAGVPEDLCPLLAAAAQAPAWKTQAKFIEIM